MPIRAPSRLALLLLRGLACLLFILADSPLQGINGAHPTEYEIKSAVLYNFVKFVNWPGKSCTLPSAPIVIGVLGKDPFGASLDLIAGQKIGNHPIQIERYASTKDIAANCHVLFISSAERDHVTEIIHTLDCRPVLTVCDGIDDFAKVGAVMNLIKTQDGRVRFEINVDAAKRADLRVDSALLNLATLVREQDAVNK
jgi:hypothetical protein